MKLIVIREMTVVIDHKNFLDKFWPKNAYQDLKHETQFIIESNKSLAENKTKNQIEQILLKYKHKDNIHQH